MRRLDAATLWVAYGKELRSFILKRVADENLADDILQDVFLRIHARIDTLTDREKAGAWVFQIARNRIIDHFKGSKRQIPLSEEEYETVGFEENMFERTQKSTFQRGVRSIISFLSDYDRELIRLSSCDGISQIDLARRFDVPYSTMKSRIQRVRRRMKALMEFYCFIEYDAGGRVVDMMPKSDNECCRRFKKF